MSRDPRPTRTQIEAIRKRADRDLEEAVEAERLKQARADGFAGKDLERLKRSSQAAVDFARSVFGKKP